MLSQLVRAAIFMLMPVEFLEPTELKSGGLNHADRTDRKR